MFGLLALLVCMLYTPRKVGGGPRPVCVLSWHLSVLADTCSLKTSWASCVSDCNIFRSHLFFLGQIPSPAGPGAEGPGGPPGHS